MDPVLLVFWFFVVWVAMMGLGLYVAQEKGRSPLEALTLSVLFGPFGVLIAALLPTRARVSEGAVTGESTARDAQAQTRPAAKNPTEDDWKDMIDWTGVVTEDDEKQAKKKAYAKYMRMFGPQVQGVRFDPDGSATFNCPCGRPLKTGPEKTGKVIECPACKLHLLVPSQAAPV